MVKRGCRLRREACTAAMLHICWRSFPQLFFYDDGLIGFDDLVVDMDVR